MSGSDSLLGRFLTAFQQALEDFTDAEIGRAWSTPPRRTDFYRRHLLPRVAKLMEMDFLPELLRIDYAFLRQGTGVPLVLIESENATFSASQEVGKLAAVRAPLRVLLSVIAWTPELGIWPTSSPGQRDVLLPTWRSIVTQHSTEYGSEGGAFLALIGEWRDDQSLAFFAHGLDASTQRDLPDDAGPTWRRQMRYSQDESVRVAIEEGARSQSP